MTVRVMTAPLSVTMWTLMDGVDEEEVPIVLRVEDDWLLDDDWALR